MSSNQIVNLLRGTYDLSGCHYNTKYNSVIDCGSGYSVAKMLPVATVSGLVFDTQDIPESERVDEPICTLSFMARADTAGDRIHAEVWGSKYLEDFTLTTEWQIFSMPYGFVYAKMLNVFFNGIVGNSGEVYMALPMAVRGTTPAAWAPAEGETLPGGGAQMSANLLEGIDPKVVNGTTKDGGVYHHAARTDESGWTHTDYLIYFLGEQPTLSENQTFHIGISVEGESVNNASLHAAIGYKDSAGNVNYAVSEAMPIAVSWGRTEGTIVIPSGMKIETLFFSAYGVCPEVWLTSPTLSYGSSGPILASDSHTPYATQDHVAAEYATKAQLKVDEDKITSEVGERTKLSGRVGTLESTSSEHTSKLTQLSSSIESMVKGEATYTAPDGTTKTNGLYSKIEQTASSINETFGQYTKTEDLASTAAVKDAKKAGTDAASAASAAQSTADAAKANAATAQTTANTAVTNASTAQSTADAAKTAAANAQSTADAANTTASNLATLIHRGDDGVTVGYSADGKTFTGGRTRQGTNSFDVLDSDGNTTASLASGKVSLLGGDVSMTAYTDGKGFTDCEMRAETSMAMRGGSLDTNSSTGNVGLGSVVADTTGASMLSQSEPYSENSEVSVGDDGFARVYGRKGVSISSDEGGMQLNGGTSIKKIFAGTSVVNSLGSDFDLFSGDDCKSRFGELIMPDNNASWVLLASPGQGSYDHHITLSPTSRGGVHGYITPSVSGNVRVQWMFIKF